MRVPSIYPAAQVEPLLVHMQVVLSRELMEGIVEQWLGEPPPSPQQWSMAGDGQQPRTLPMLLTAASFPATVSFFSCVDARGRRGQAGLTR